MLMKCPNCGYEGNNFELVGKTYSGETTGGCLGILVAFPIAIFLGYLGTFLFPGIGTIAGGGLGYYIGKKIYEGIAKGTLKKITKTGMSMGSNYDKNEYKCPKCGRTHYE